LNGEILEQGHIDATSAGALLGWGVFTTIGIRDGEPMFLRQHAERLRRDALAADVPLAYSDAQIAKAAIKLLEGLEIGEGLLRLTLTRRGDDRWNLTSGSDLLITVHEAPRPKATDLHVQISPYRVESARPLAGVKLTSYLPYLWAWKQAVAAGFDEALLLTSEGHLCEAARSNLFWSRDGAIVTPTLGTGCMDGVGREQVKEWALRRGVPFHEVQEPLPALASASEVWLVSGAAGPRSVGCIDTGRTTWHYEPGPMYDALAGMW